jgi:hypothetical protein
MSRNAIWLLTLTLIDAFPCLARTDELTVTVAEPAGVSRTGWPVTSGVPLAEGALRDAQAAALFTADEREVPLQTEALSRWPDGSIRWLLLDFQTDLEANQTQRYTLRYGPGTRRSPVEKPVTLNTEGQVVTIDTGPLRLLLSPTEFRLPDRVWLDANNDGRFAADEQVTGPDDAGIVLITPDGNVFRADRAPAKLTVEDSGPLRASVRIEGGHGSAEGAMFRYVVRVHAFRGQSCLIFQYTFVNNHQDALMAKIDALDLVFAHAQKDGCRIVLDGKERAPGRLFQVDYGRFDVDGKLAGRRGAGWAAVGTDHLGMAVGVREWWQNWPKDIEAAANRIRVGICPGFPRGLYDGKPLTEECKLTYDLRDGVYSYKCGVARTHELWATFFAGKPEATRLAEFFRAVEMPLLGQCESAHVSASRTLGPLPPSDPKYRAYDALVADCFARHLADRDRVREYGLLNYGDWYNTNWDAWGNLEYDTSRIWFQQYLRTGDRRYFDRAEQAARHFLDVDVLHATHPQVRAYPGSADMRPGQIWPHCVGHTGGYYARYVTDKYEDEAPLKLTGAYQVGLWDFGHVWVGGVFDYYLLTGDRRAREVGVLASDAMAALCPTRYSDHIRNVGWPLHLLLNAYEATGDKKYLTAAGKQWQVLKDHLDPKKGWVVLLAYGHCSVPAELGRCRGNNMYMLGITLTALARYHRITGDPVVLEALSTGIDQMIREGWSEQYKSFYLTSCRHSQTAPPPRFCSVTFHASEAFAYEALRTGNTEHRRIMREALGTALAAGAQALADNELLGQTGYYSGIFLFAPFGLSTLDEPIPDRRER